MKDKCIAKWKSTIRFSLLLFILCSLYMLYNSKHFYYFLYLKWASDLNPCSIQTDLRVKEMKAFWGFFQVSGVRLVWGCSCWLRMLRAMWLDLRWCSLPWSPPPRRPCQVSSTPIEVTVHFQWRRLNVNKLNYPSDLT